MIEKPELDKEVAATCTVCGEIEYIQMDECDIRTFFCEECNSHLKVYLSSDGSYKTELMS